MKHITILGIGGLSGPDEDFGPCVVAALHARYHFAKSVQAIDGTQSLALPPLIATADVLILLDAVDCGLEPGAFIIADNAAALRQLQATKPRPCQSAMAEALDQARMQGRLPRRLRLIGVQPPDPATHHGSLSPLLRGRVDITIDYVLACLAESGVNVRPWPKGEAKEIFQAEAMVEEFHEKGCFA